MNKQMTIRRVEGQFKNFKWEGQFHYINETF